MLYRSSYDSRYLRGLDAPSSPRPWEMTEKLKTFASKKKRLLDLGTGTGFKVAPLQDWYKEIIGIEISKSMVNAARHNFQHENMFAIQGSNYALPFRSNSFDVVTCMLSFWDPGEIRRVLNPNGLVLIELLGCEDKKEFKTFFGADNDGVRGQYLNFNQKDYISDIYQRFRNYFHTVSIQNGFWETYYSPKGILKLLANTPTIRGFNYQQDKVNLKKAITALSTPNGIKIKQNRMLLYAADPK
jgi:SAM-dependent methyltransferase